MAGSGVRGTGAGEAHAAGMRDRHEIETDAVQERLVLDQNQGRLVLDQVFGARIFPAAAGMPT